MATNFPTSLDTLTNPSATDTLDSPPHDEQHADANDAIEALQAKVGVDSSAVTTSLDYKVAQLEAISHGKILQVVSTTKTDTFSTTSTSYTDVTGLSVSITPSSATSKIFVTFDVAVSGSTNTVGMGFQIVRDSTAIGGGTAAGSRKSASKAIRHWAANTQNALSGSHLDSPATTSATTYKIQVVSETGLTAYVNRSSADSDDGNPNNARTSSTITVFEVSA